MNERKQIAIDGIENKKELITDVADEIWNYAELSLQEEKSAALYMEILKQEGFTVECAPGTPKMPTAFSATYGNGRPIIGILAEYDALSGLSQTGGTLSREEIIPGGNGHGCGHNLLGAGALAAALGIKAYLESNPDKGTVILFGCPGEEAGASKAFWARDGFWRNLDAALTWHPGDTNEIMTGSSNSCIQTFYRFSGVASHASGAPELGRSALDAVELMNIGVQFLREHMSDKARVHYAITNAGGISPNVVQAKADVLYFVRSNHVSEAVALQKRVDKIADAAAMMTETTVSRQFIDGLSDTIINRTLERVLYENFEEIGVPVYSKEELEFADALSMTYESRDALPGLGTPNSPDYADVIKKLREERNHAMNDFLLPYYEGEVFRAGSTDVGDVSWECPTSQILVAAWPNGTPGHSWQNVSCGKTSIGHKAALHAGKVLAAAAIDLYENPAILEEAKAEFERRTASGFVSPIPAGAVPIVPEF